MFITLFLSFQLTSVYAAENVLKFNPSVKLPQEQSDDNASDAVESCEVALHDYIRGGRKFRSWLKRDQAFKERRSAEVLARIPKGAATDVLIANGVWALGPFEEDYHYLVVVTGPTSSLLAQQFPPETDFQILSSSVHRRQLALRSTAKSVQIRFLKNTTAAFIQDQIGGAIQQTVFVNDYTEQNFYVVPAQALRGISAAQFENWKIEPYQLDPKKDLIGQVRELGGDLKNRASVDRYRDVVVVSEPAMQILNRLEEQKVFIPNAVPSDEAEIPAEITQALRACENGKCFTQNKIHLLAGTPPPAGFVYTEKSAPLVEKSPSNVVELRHPTDELTDAPLPAPKKSKSKRIDPTVGKVEKIPAPVKSTVTKQEASVAAQDLRDPKRTLDFVREVFAHTQHPVVRVKPALRRIERELPLSRGRKIELAGRIFMFEPSTLERSQEARANLSRILEVFAESQGLPFSPVPTIVQQRALVKALSAYFK